MMATRDRGTIYGTEAQEAWVVVKLGHGTGGGVGRSMDRTDGGGQARSDWDWAGLGGGWAGSCRTGISKGARDSGKGWVVGVGDHGGNASGGMHERFELVSECACVCVRVYHTPLSPSLHSAVC